jgi:hypothetical protein
MAVIRYGVVAKRGIWVEKLNCEPGTHADAGIPKNL